MESKNPQLIVVLRLAFLFLFGIVLSSLLQYYLFPSIHLTNQSSQEEVNNYLFSIGLSQLCLFVFPSLIWLKWMQESVLKSINKKRDLFIPVFFAICLFIAVYGLNELISFFINHVDNFHWMNDLQEKQSELYTTIFGEGKDIILPILVIGILPAIAEELFFRRILFGYFSERTMRFWKPALISSFLFAFIHFQPALFVPMFILAMLFAFLYYVSGSIIIGVILHALNNIFQLLLIHYHWEISSSSWIIISSLALVTTVLLVMKFRNYFGSLFMN